MIGQWAAETPPVSASELLRRYWEWAGRPDNLRIIRMLIEATTLGHSAPFAEVGQRAVQQWISVLSEALRRDGVTEHVQRIATQTYATLVGLQVDLIGAVGQPQSPLVRPRRREKEVIANAAPAVGLDRNDHQFIATLGWTF